MATPSHFLLYVLVFISIFHTLYRLYTLSYLLVLSICCVSTLVVFAILAVKIIKLFDRALTNISQGHRVFAFPRDDEPITSRMWSSSRPSLLTASLDKFSSIWRWVDFQLSI